VRSALLFSLDGFFRCFLQQLGYTFIYIFSGGSFVLALFQRGSAPGKHVFVVLLAFLLYLVSFLAIYFTVGFGSSIIAVLPVAIIAWSYGCRAGIFAGLFAGPINIAMYSLLEENWFEKGIATGTIIVGSATVILIGATVGRLRDLGNQLACSNEVLNAEVAERKRIEQELMLHRKHLDELVHQKTSELQAASMQLIQSTKMASLGTLVAGIAHEINNPVNLITINLPIVQDVWKDARPILHEACMRDPDLTFGGLPPEYMDSKFEKLLSDMRVATSRIVRIIDGLKSFSRKSSLDALQPVGINDAVNNALLLAKNTADKAGITLDIGLCDNLRPIQADPLQVEQIILNLIINAIEAIDHDHGRISIRSGYADHSDQVYVSIADNGCGIDDSIAQQIFDPFFTRKQARGGTGLGLSIVYTLVKEHGGTIAFKPNEGGGTVFSVCFSAARPA
jgi:signal transduction histidine kinase